MTATIRETRSDQSQLTDAPLLRDGEIMDCDTFHSRYELTPEGFRAELVGGIVHIMSPIGPEHADAHSPITGCLWLYQVSTPGVVSSVEPTILLGWDSEPQPDACLRILPEYGGKTKIERGYISGPPELIVEVSVSSVSRDRGAKKADYESAGVGEYLVLAPGNPGDLAWFSLVNGTYNRLVADEDGIVRSRQFPGLWIEPRAMLAGDDPRTLEVLRLGLSSPEHQRWAAELQARAAIPPPG